MINDADSLIPLCRALATSGTLGEQIKWAAQCALWSGHVACRSRGAVYAAQRPSVSLGRHSPTTKARLRAVLITHIKESFHVDSEGLRLLIGSAESGPISGTGRHRSGADLSHPALIHPDPR